MPGIVIKQLPKEWKDYEWIANRLIKIDGVKDILMLEVNDFLIMTLTNSKPGKAKKCFDIPLREFFIVDYTLAPNAPHYYDINKLDNPEAMFKVIEQKAKMFFAGIRV